MSSSAPVTKTGDEVRRIVYLCRNCGAEDTAKLDVGEGVPPAINCWKCKAGRGMPMGTMIEHGLGMFPQASKPESTPATKVAEKETMH